MFLLMPIIVFLFENPVVLVLSLVVGAFLLIALICGVFDTVSPRDDYYDRY